MVYFVLWFKFVVIVGKGVGLDRRVFLVCEGLGVVVGGCVGVCADVDSGVLWRLAGVVKVVHMWSDMWRMWSVFEMLVQVWSGYGVLWRRVCRCGMNVEAMEWLCSVTEVCIGM